MSEFSESDFEDMAECEGVEIEGETVSIRINDIVVESEEGDEKLGQVIVQISLETFRQIVELTAKCDFSGPVETISTIIDYNALQESEGAETQPFEFFVEYPYLLTEFSQYEMEDDENDF